MTTAAPPANSASANDLLLTPAWDRSVELPHFSIIVPSTNDEMVLTTCYETLHERIDHERYRWELIYVDHGTSELAWIAIHRLLKRDPKHVRAFIFRRNQERCHALALGYREARGELVFTVEMDLDDDPREIPTFLDRIQWECPEPRTRATAENGSWQQVLPRGIMRRSSPAPVVAA